jgi:pimeloyl-ACP methyl ester carboxylesterase
MTDVNGYSVRYLNYDAHKSGKSLILLHGIGASADRWLPILPTLSKYFRVVVPDIVGFGYSDKPTVEYTMDFFLDFLSEFNRKLDISKPIIVGSSFGGHVATEYSIRFPRAIDKLILVSPAGIMRTSTPTLDGYIMAALYPTIENATKAFANMAYDTTVVTEDIVSDFVNRMNLPNAKYAFMSTLLGMRYAPKLQGRLSQILVPTLLIWGDSDKMIPVQYAKEYREIPNQELVVVKNCGHTPFVEKPTTFTKVLLKFLIGSYNS